MSAEPSKPARRGLFSKQRSLRVELIATLAGVLVIAVVSLSLATELLGERRHDAQELERLQEHTRGVAMLVSRQFDGAETFDRSAVRPLLHQSTAGQLGVIAVRIYVVEPDHDTRLLESVGLAEDLPPPFDATPRVDESYRNERNFILIDEPIPRFGRGDGRIPVLRVIAQPSPWASAHDWSQTLILAGGVSVVLLVLGFFLVDLQVLRPMKQLESAVARVGVGELEVSVPEEGPTEIRRLAGSFNEMTQALRYQRDVLASQSKALKRSEQLAAVGTLAAGVAHEVGNPLAAILGYIEFLLDPRSELADEQRELLERVRDQTTRIQGIVRQLLELASPSEEPLVRVHLRESLDSVANLLGADPRTQGVQVEVTGAASTVASAHAGRVEQIVLNLAVNACLAAIDAHGDPSKARVGLRAGASIEHPDRVWIEVQDNGPGVAPEIREQLFTPFVTTRKAGEGTGLGLAISQGLAEGMGGELVLLDAEARQPLATGEGRGATFRLSLPAAQDPEAQD